MRRFVVVAGATSLMFAALPSSAEEGLAGLSSTVTGGQKWNGLYGGLNIGFSAGANANAESVASSSAALIDYFGPLGAAPYYPMPTGFGAAQTSRFNTTQSGVVGGGQVGFNHVLVGRLLVGIEADIQGAGISGTGNGVGAGGASNTYVDGLFGPALSYTDTFRSAGRTQVRTSVDWLGTVRGRLGYLVTPDLLVFATGGLSYGGGTAAARSLGAISQERVRMDTGLSSLDYSATRSFFGGGSSSSTQVGWNVGGGAEWMLTPNVSLKAEAIYWNLGDLRVSTYGVAPSPSPGACPCYASNPAFSAGNARVSLQGVIARGGINYHFNVGPGLM